MTGQFQETGADHSQKTQNQNKKRDGSRDSDDRLRDLPECLEEFTGNLEDSEVSAPSHISQDSHSERPTRVAPVGIAESAVRRVKDGMSAVPLQSGLDEKWWADSMECHCCCLRNVQDLLEDGKILMNGDSENLFGDR